MKSKLLNICNNKLLVAFGIAMLSLHSLKAQSGDKTLDWLNDNVTKTVRYGLLNYEYTAFFDENGFCYMFNEPKVARWSTIQGLGTTNTNRVYIAFDNTKGVSIYQYVTPKEGITAEAVMWKINEALYKRGYKSVKIWKGLKDGDEMYLLRKQQEEATRPKTHEENLQIMGEALERGNEAINEAVSILDPIEKTKFTYCYINYTGLAVGSPQVFIEPSVFSGNFGASMHRLYMSLDFRMGYMASPIYEYNLNKINYYDSYPRKSPANETVLLQNIALNMSVGVGVNIPIKNVLFYGLYGGDFMPFTLKTNVLTAGFENDGESPIFPMWNRRFTVGTILTIPKTKLAIGIQYNFNRIKGETDDDGSHEILKISEPESRYHYYLGTTTQKEYKFKNLGFSFMWKL